MTVSVKVRHIRLRSGDPNPLCEQPGLLITIQTEIFSYYDWKDVIKYWKNNVMCKKCTEIFRDHLCSQYPLCYTCEFESDVPHRICTNCYELEWDEYLNCSDDDIPFKHNCKSGTWICEGSHCLAEQQQSEMHEYAIGQAGGLDEIQRQERLRYYGEE